MKNEADQLLNSIRFFNALERYETGRGYFWRLGWFRFSRKLLLRMPEKIRPYGWRRFVLTGHFE